ncbi:ATP binding, partial [Rhizoctonia solani]
MSGIKAPGGNASRSFEDPWDGPSKIVIGIDIGSTQSGVAFAFLQQGAKQSIHRVTQWPGQESQNLHGKVPTILWYDSTQKAVSFGAEALTPQAEEDAEDGQWKLAKYFKLHLHPPHLTAQHGLDLEPLPFNVPLSQIYSDFLGYLLQHTQSYFEDHIIDGKRIWQQYKPSMEVVLAHPNGWGIREQAFLRLAAVKAGFTNASDAPSRVHFVNEAEASVHFCTLYSDIGSQLKARPGTTFAVCDAGGSTVDTTVYSVKSLNPIRLEETRASDCVQAGALFIDQSAEKYLRKVLHEAGLAQEDVDEYATKGTKDFELHSKRAFKDVTTDQSIEIAGTRFNNTAIRARRGRMTLPGSEVKIFFDFCTNQILESVNSQLQGSSVSHILLVGGFGESPFLREQLKQRFGPMGCDVTITSERTSKAVADGTIIWYSSNNVVKRTPWYSYGIEILIPHKPQAKDHKRRQVVQWPTGSFVKGGWSQIVPGGVPVDCDSISRRPYYREYTTPNPQLSNFAEDIWCYNLKGVPQWMRFKPGTIMPGFQLACSVNANLSHMRGALQAHTSPKGTRYWSLSFNVCIHFGRTEYRAFLEWVENGTTRTGPAQLISTTGPANMYADQMELAGADTSIDEPERPHNPDGRSSPPDRERTHRVPTTGIMLLGSSGSGKSSLFNLAINKNMQTISESNTLCTEKFRQSPYFTVNERSFLLFDSPGFHTASMNDSAIFKKLIAYLARPREGRYGPKLSGILYLHSEEKAVGDERLKSTMEGLRHLVGDPWVPFITIGVIGKESNSNSTDMITQLQAPTSPFHSLHSSGAKILPLSLELPKIQEVFLGFEPTPPSKPRLFYKVKPNYRFGRLQLDGLDQFVEELTRHRGTPTDTTKKSVHPRNKITYEESEASRHQLQFTLDETETELQSLRSQLEQTQLEYSSLRSELQLNDNTEQSKLVQSLSDLNRAVDDFGRSVAEHVVDNYKTDRFDEEDPTTLNALDFLGLQRQFGHQGGKSSLVASSKGEGLPIEDFIDLALRGFVCQKLCKNVFNPFHPTLTAGVEHDFMASLYEEVRRQASPIVASKWRANSFMALSKGNKLDQSMIESQVESLLAGDIQQLVNNLFGHSGVVTITDGQRSQLRNIVTSAWELNYVLKGEAVTLGDFQPLYVKSGTPFDSKAMVEFEANKKKKPGDVAIYTIRLGLTLSHSKGARQDAKPVIICPATVVTPRIFSYGNSNHEYEAPAFQTTVNIVITWDEPLYPPNLPPFTSIRATMTATNPEGQKNQKNTRGNSRASAKSGTPNNRPNANPKQTNGRTSGTVAAQDAAATPVNSARSKDRIPHVPILILGVQGCGKSTFINAALAQPLREISNGLELATKEFHYDTLSSPKTNFILVDSPGFDNMSISDGEIMTKLIHFLCCGKAPAKMAGVIYLHTQESRLGSGVLRRNLSLIKALLGESFLERLIILIVPRPGEEVNEKEIIRPLLDTSSPFRNLCDLGAQVKVSSLETEPIRNLLLPYAEKPPLLMTVQSELCGSGRIPNEGDINLYLVKCARAREGGLALTRSRVATQSISQIQNHVSSPARQGSKDVKKLELQLAESKKQMEDSHSQLQQHLSQYTALCSQLQIHENIEQSEVVQNLVDINRRIEDLALSLSQYLVDTYGGHDKVTTEYAAQLSKLKEMFEHDERRGSLVQSSKGVGMLLEDFLDVAFRSILCEQLYKRIFVPFHPAIPASDPKNQYTSKLYERIKEKETQATLGRWRTASFAAISGVIGEPELSRLKAQAGLDILNDNLMPMLGHLFGSGKSVKLSGGHKESLAELVTQAWDWCVVLKERIVLLGDYQPIAYRYGALFDTNTMSEFEPQPGSQHEQILSSIGLGLNVGLAQGTGEGLIRTNILKVSVVTEGWFR